jgi:RNA polymerase sigma factor (sigma-70 family)
MRCSHLCSYTTMSLFLSSAESRYNQWVKEHYRFLIRSAWALTGSKVLAEDIVQDVYFLAWKHRKQLKDESLARAWLFRIMRRCVIRHAQPKTSQLDDEANGNIDQFAPDSDSRIDSVRALARIAPIHREVLVLYYFDDMSTMAIAEALEIAPGTVMSRLARARDALKQVMNPAPPVDSSNKITTLLRSKDG